VVIAGAAEAPEPLPQTLIAFEDLRQATIDRRRELIFSEVMKPFEVLTDGRTFVYHCHILDHEDRGMMGVVEVVE
jgi:FtsP/CotA-like multicopper oxidase with cupredoxin domain